MEFGQSVKVVNNLAERGVALVQEFNSSLTRNEEQKQYLLQLVEHHKGQFAEPTKPSNYQHQPAILTVNESGNFFITNILALTFYSVDWTAFYQRKGNK